MSFATFSMIAYTVLAFGGMLYGASFDRFAMLIATLPGLFGLLGFMTWAASGEGHAYWQDLEDSKRRARITRMRTRLQRTGRIA